VNPNLNMVNPHYPYYNPYYMWYQTGIQPPVSAPVGETVLTNQSNQNFPVDASATSGKTQQDQVPEQKSSVQKEEYTKPQSSKSVNFTKTTKPVSPQQTAQNKHKNITTSSPSQYRNKRYQKKI